jgi:hypothetical protein
MQACVQFEEAEFIYDEDHLRQVLRFVVVGGGPTGVEFAGALLESSWHCAAASLQDRERSNANASPSLRSPPSLQLLGCCGGCLLWSPWGVWIFILF